MKKALWFLRVLVLGSLTVLLVIPSTINAGSPVDGSFVISAGSEQEVYPTVAYNSQRQEYLVVWYNDRPGCDDIRAQRVSSGGALVGGPFYIAAGCPADRHYPDVAYNSAHDQYMVVWEQYEAANGYSIKARRVSGTGQILMRRILPSAIRALTSIRRSSQPWPMPPRQTATWSCGQKRGTRYPSPTRSSAR